MNKILMPILLSATIIVAGLFAFLPVEQVSAVHTTITDDNQSTTEDMERMIILQFSTGTTPANDVFLAISADGAGISGSIMGMVIDATTSDGTADLDFECHDLGATTLAAVSGDDNSDDAGTLVNAGDDIDNPGEQVVDTLSSCELLTADIADDSDVIIAIHIDNWPEI